MWTKICGIRDVPTAKLAAQLGAQAIGLNFFARSPRCVDVETAADIVRQVPAGVEPVGLFVNHSVAEIEAIADRCGLRTIQLHGDEPPEMLAELQRFRIIRAFRVGQEGLADGSTYLQACRRLNALPWACLIDARVAGAYGGTGHMAPWDVVRDGYLRGEWPQLILAGGLNPDNVADAIRTVQPWGVDVAGGVESSVACKDAALMRDFIQRASAVTMEDGR